jgi:hypothetical protein
MDGKESLAKDIESTLALDPMTQTGISEIDAYDMVSPNWLGKIDCPEQVEADYRAVLGMADGHDPDAFIDAGNFAWAILDQALSMVDWTKVLEHLKERNNHE